MSAKPAKRKTDEAAPTYREESYFRLKLMPASLVQYAVEKVTVVDDVVVERKVITERDVLAIALSKIEDYIVQEVRR